MKFYELFSQKKKKKLYLKKQLNSEPIQLFINTQSWKQPLLLISIEEKVFLLIIYKKRIYNLKYVNKRIFLRYSHDTIENTPKITYILHKIILSLILFQYNQFFNTRTIR